MNDGLSEHGCNLGSKCEHIHVKICKESLEKRECTKCTQEKRCSDGLKRLMGPPDSDGWQFHLDTGYCDVTIPIYGVIEAIFVVHF